MAAILDENESRDFHAFLDSLDKSTESEAAIVGGSGLVFRRGTEGSATSWDASPNGAGLHSAVTSNGGQSWRPPPYAQHPTAQQLFPHLLGGAPSSYAPPPQHISRPSFPLSYATPPLPLPYAPPPPPSVPYPAAPLEALDQDKLERMAKQARELSEWMGARGDGPAAAPSLPPDIGGTGDERPEQGDEGRRVNGASASGVSSGTRAGVERRGYSHERPPLMRPPPSGVGSIEDTMQRMREAEERIGFARRVKEANDESEEMRARYRSRKEQSAAAIDFNAYNQPIPSAESPTSFVPRAPPPAASAPPRRRRSPTPPIVKIEPDFISVPPPTNRKAAASAKGKAPARASAVKAPPPNDTDFDTDPALNPAPFSTPSNIPPSPYHPPQAPVRRRVSPSPASNSASTSTSGTASKPALLTAEQKKANHIASEQKRRAAIRQGYEALCTVVPALKAAVEEFEERVKKLGAGGGGRGTKKRRGSSGAAVAGPLSGGIDVGGEKVDGRAGPKSEAVVLGKTVEHLRNLLHERQALLERLSSLYEHGADSNVQVEGGRRIWEEQWDGGPVIVGGSAVEEDAEADEEDE